MDTIAAIFEQLGVNISLIYQFGLFFAVYMIVRPLFISRMQDIIETRIEKTSDLEAETNDLEAEVERLQDELKQRLSGAYKTRQDEVTSKKKDIASEYDRQFSNFESEQMKFLETRIGELDEQATRVKGELNSKTDELAGQLVSKLSIQ